MRNRKKDTVHIDYGHPVRPYHKVVACLVAKYCRGAPSIIDIGCGVGHTLCEVKDLLPSAKLVAADLDSHCLHITGQKVALHEKIQISEIEQLFERENSFDAVIMSHVLEHSKRPVETVKGAMRILRPDGILVLAVPNPVRPKVFLAALMRRHYVNRGHVCAWDRSHWMNFLENILRLKVICYSQDFVELPFLRRFQVVRSLEGKLCKLFPWLSFSNIAVVRKEAAKVE